MGLADRRIAPTGITVGIPKETQFGAVQVAATPQVVGMLIKSCGYTVVVESGAGEASGYSNDQYLAAGAQLLDAVSAWASDIVFKVNAPNLQEVELATQGGMVISYFPA
jgi:NAD(P) transhydrogenase subunit alpha